MKILDLAIKLWSILVNSCDMWSCQLKLLQLKSILTCYVAFVLICCMNPIGLILVSTYFANPACADSAVSGLSNALYVDKALMAAMPTEVIDTSLTIFFEDINYYLTDKQILVDKIKSQTLNPLASVITWTSSYYLL